MSTAYPRAEIDLGQLGRNIAALKAQITPNTQLMAVVKANAYGHGMLPVASASLRYGAQALGVARLEEAIQLRMAGILEPIHLLGPVHAADARELLEHRITVSISGWAEAEALAQYIRGKGVLTAHLKIDTGMGRCGFFAQECAQFPNLESLSVSITSEVKAIRSIPEIRLEGVYTHFAGADETEGDTAHRQLQIFNTLVQTLEQKGLRPRICHAANSAAIFRLPDSHYDLVRAGMALHGICGHSNGNLKPTLSFKTQIAVVKEVPAGATISYGMTYRTPKATRIATVSLGYADGFNRANSNGGRVLVRGEFAPIIGRICMDFTMLDVGHIPQVGVGDEVVVYGRQGEREIFVEEVAQRLETIPYEVLTSITPRVPRVYKDREPSMETPDWDRAPVRIH